MPKAKSKTNLIRLKCSVCKRVNYFTKKHKNVERKLEYKKYCSWCRKSVAHKESKK